VLLIATVGAKDANSYLTLADASAYFATRLRSDAWDGASETDQEKALVVACRRIETLRLQVHRRPSGYPAEALDAMDRRWDWLAPMNADQALSFPRQRDQDATGAYLVPPQVQQAQCEEALALLARGAEDEKRRALQAAGVTAFSVDGLSESYGAGAGAAAHTLLSAEARLLIAPFIERGGIIATSDDPDGEWSAGSGR
jgi:hypothetical protein